MISKEKIPKGRIAMATWITQTSQTTGPLAALRTLPKQREVACTVVPNPNPNLLAKNLAKIIRAMRRIVRNSSGPALIPVILTSEKTARKRAMHAVPVENMNRCWKIKPQQEKHQLASFRLSYNRHLSKFKY